MRLTRARVSPSYGCGHFKVSVCREQMIMRMMKLSNMIAVAINGTS